MNKLLLTLLGTFLIGGSVIYVVKVQSKDSTVKQTSDAWHQGEIEKAEMYKKIREIK